MTDDLVKRLRSNELSYLISDTVDLWDKQRNEAADRIEKLEDALKELLSLGEWGLNDLARTVAREALEEKEGA
jgi:predicted secreted acid phosphatase